MELKMKVYRRKFGDMKKNGKWKLLCTIPSNSSDQIIIEYGGETFDISKAAFDRVGFSISTNKASMFIDPGSRQYLNIMSTIAKEADNDTESG